MHYIILKFRLKNKNKLIFFEYFCTFIMYKNKQKLIKYYNYINLNKALKVLINNSKKILLNFRSFYSYIFFYIFICKFCKGKNFLKNQFIYAKYFSYLARN